MRLSPLLVMLVFLPLVAPASADELSELRERVMQLEATVEELTLQLADSLKERRRLEAELAGVMATAGAAVAAPSAGAAASPVAADAAMSGQEAAVTVEETIEETAVASAAAGRSEAGAAEAAASQASGAGYTRSADCDVAQALAGYDGKRKGNETLEAWLQADDHLARCSTAQLEQIRKAVKWDWLGYEKPVLKLIDKELARR